ncbi:helix-turn-helix domain-containing protein [Nocardia sp. NPDC004711]
MTQARGRRELNKMATRQALQAAADRLFAERGYSATTIREISDQAGVNERTFFRYFAGKEELLVDELITRLPLLTDQIRARPNDEAPLVAVQRAVLGLIQPNRGRIRPTVLSVYLEQRSEAGLGLSGLSLALRFEEAIAAAIGDRLSRMDPVPADLDFLADLYGRTAVAVLRSVLLRDRQLRMQDADSRPDLIELIEQAFSALPAAWRT